MLGELVGSRPARYFHSWPLVGSAVAHTALITAVLVTTRGAGPNSHGSQLARRATPVVHLQYVKLIPNAGLPSGEALNPSENHATTSRANPTRGQRGSRAQL